MMTTKKLLQSMTKDGKATLRGEFLVPYVLTPRRNCFIGLKTGKTYDSGYLVYIGKEVSTGEIITKLDIAEDAEADVRALLQSFMDKLSVLKIGNVVSVSFPESNRCILKKEAESPNYNHKKKLP
jgi:hypothetical protein